MNLIMMGIGVVLFFIGYFGNEYIGSFLSVLFLFFGVVLFLSSFFVKKFPD